YLFIDEIDNGIHFSILDTIWKTILTLSKELNVQVFATTHSKECIESFNHAQLKISNTPSSYFEMVRGSKTGKLSMRALDSDQLDYELKHQGRYRGE
ncbi:MAG TPA: ATP-binding protein, partial [Leucothrix mucor]|nr:ATP-binding protein [Leucothrix mucor]